MVVMQRKGNSGVQVTSEGQRLVETSGLGGKANSKNTSTISPHLVMKGKVRKGLGNKPKVNLILPQNFTWG